MRTDKTPLLNIDPPLFIPCCKGMQLFWVKEGLVCGACGCIHVESDHAKTCSVCSGERN